MGRITELSLRDVRCFEGEQSARLRRITILVGENGTGKSTFLGCHRALATLANMIDLEVGANHFDAAPFHMGSFDTIARTGRAEFTIGGAFDDHCHSRASFCFVRGKQSAPRERRVVLEFAGRAGGGAYLAVTRRPAKKRVTRFEGPNFRLDLDDSEISYDDISTWLSRYARRGILPFGGDPSIFRARNRSSVFGADESAFVKFVNFFRSELPLPGDASFVVEALDPTLPERRRLYESLPPHLNDEGNSELEAGIASVGAKLKLWQGVSFAPTADGRGVEVLVDTTSGPRNLIDVGYGVHSLLPLVRAIHGQPGEAVFLLQQPEIHVHPIAQARLAQIMARSNHGFMIETHSDHFVDRFRICVMNGLLRPDDLSVVYFEPTDDGTQSRIHSIAVDDQGNLVDVPDGYRAFFLRETERLLGFDE